MTYQLPIDRKLNVQVVYTDIAGNVVQPDPGTVVWSSSVPSVITVTVDSADQCKAWITCSSLGNADAVASLTPNGAAVTASFSVTVVAGSAVNGTISPVGGPQPAKKS
jgi:hypothetical protein